MTYSAYAETFLDECRQRGLRKGTLVQYRANVNQFCAFLEAQDASVTEESVLAYLSSIRDQFKQSSVNQKIVTASLFLDHLVDLQVIPENPMKKLNIRQKKQTAHIKTVDMDAIAAVLRCAYFEKGFSKEGSCSYRYALRDIAVLELLFLTGMRVSEISRLKPLDVDLEAKTVHIRGEGNQDRILRIDNQDTLRALSAYRIAFWYQMSEAEHFFVNRQGKGFSEDSVRNLVKRYAKQACLSSEFTPKVLRDSVATFLADEGADLLSLQQMLGHNCISQTQKYVQPEKRALETNHLRSQLKMRNK